jgi:ABC-type glycerol-3-phosphate transport system permease component
MRDRILESKTLSYGVAIFVLSLMMMPIYWTVVTAFKPDTETYVFPPVYFPSSSPSPPRWWSRSSA